jgi:signal transduction histidine kinase
VLRDNGVGMDLAAPRSGFGLIIMRERARNLGGSFELWSQPGGGTRIAVKVPLLAGGVQTD